MQRRITAPLVALGVIALAVALATAFQFTQSTRVAQSQSTPASSGVKLAVTGASLPGDRKPVVSFKLTDDNGSPLRLSDLDANSLRFTIAVLKQEDGTGRTFWENPITNAVRGAEYTKDGQRIKPALESVAQPTADSGGVFTDKGGGSYQYAFKTALPAGSSNSATYRIGGQVTRDSRASVGNSTFDFVPSGGAKQAREVVTTEACNRCHDPLAIHGGTRREVGYCVTCHTSQNVDPESGDTVDIKVMIHRIHRGANLPSVKAGNPYYIVGNSLRSFDFSGVVWPQDVRNCTTCHAGAQGEVWKTQPSAEACGSCHDNVNFQTGQNHGGGPQANTACKTCHPADGPEFGLSVAGAHTIPEKSAQLRGVNFEIVSLTNTKPGQSPTVVFNVKDKAGQAIAPSEMARLAFTLAGPTSEYSSVLQETAEKASTPTGDGNFRYTFTAKIPNDATGTFAVGVEGYLQTGLKDPSGNPAKNSAGQVLSVRDVGFNKVAYGAVTDSKPLPRKQVVDINNCNQCHETLALHGGGRRNTEYCILCHNPLNNDTAKRTTANGPQPPESIHFKTLIHKIHTGEELSQKPFIIYGGSPASPGPIDLSEIVFPGDRRNCEKCHVPGSQLLAFARAGALPTTVKVGDRVISSIPPITAACTSCHDSEAAKVHAQAQANSAGAESCVVCHNEGREFSVSKSHAR